MSEIKIYKKNLESAEIQYDMLNGSKNIELRIKQSIDGGVPRICGGTVAIELAKIRKRSLTLKGSAIVPNFMCGELLIVVMPNNARDEDGYSYLDELRMEAIIIEFIISYTNNTPTWSLEMEEV